MSLRVTRLAWGCKIGGAPKLALMALADWADIAGHCWPSMVSIATRMDCSTKQARRVVHHLIDMGLISVTCNIDGGPPGSSRHYKINLSMLQTTPAAGSPTSPTDGRGTAPTDGSGTAPMDVPDGSHTRSRRLPPMGAKLSRTTKNRKRVNGSGAYEGFETFYNAYPRKRARAAAMKAWDKLQPDLDLQGAILRAIEQQRGCEQWRRDNGAYIPHPATWLNGRRWEDVVAADRPAPQGLAI